MLKFLQATYYFVYKECVSSSSCAETCLVALATDASFPQVFDMLISETSLVNKFELFNYWTSIKTSLLFLKIFLVSPRPSCSMIFLNLCLSLQGSVFYLFANCLYKGIFLSFALDPRRAVLGGYHLVAAHHEGCVAHT